MLRHAASQMKTRTFLGSKAHGISNRGWWLLFGRRDALSISEWNRVPKQARTKASCNKKATKNPCRNKPISGRKEFIDESQKNRNLELGLPTYNSRCCRNGSPRTPVNSPTMKLTWTTVSSEAVNSRLGPGESSGIGNVEYWQRRATKIGNATTRIRMIWSVKNSAMRYWGS